MKINRFVMLFKKYGWHVDQLDSNSFSAYNGTYFVPFSFIPSINSMDECISAVSYLVCDKDDFIREWKMHNRLRPIKTPIDIGTYAFGRYFEKDTRFFHFGKLANHDHDEYEVEAWLREVSKI